MEKSRLKQFYLLFIAILLIVLAINAIPQIKKEVEYKRELADVKTEVNQLYVEEGIPKRGVDSNELDVLIQRALELDSKEGDLLVEGLELVEKVNIADKLWLEINKEGTLPNEHNIDIYRFKDSVEDLPEVNQAQFIDEIEAFEKREIRLENLYEEKKKQYLHEFEVVKNEWLGNLNQEGPEPYEAMVKDLVQNNESRVFDDVIDDADYLIAEFEKNNQKMLASITKNAHKSKKSNFMTQFKYYFKQEENNEYVLYTYNEFNIDYKLAVDFFMLKNGETDRYLLNTSTQSEKVIRLRELSSYDEEPTNGDEFRFVILKAKSDTELCRFDEENFNKAVELTFRPAKGVEFGFGLPEVRN